MLILSNFTMALYPCLGVGVIKKEAKERKENKKERFQRLFAQTTIHKQLEF
jgi:hypothetical protein